LLLTNHNVLINYVVYDPSGKLIVAADWK